VEVPKGITDPIDIALYEFEQGVCPVTVIRQRKTEGEEEAPSG
jgi:DNA-directed RNA polymerase subunit K/omega